MVRQVLLQILFISILVTTTACAAEPIDDPVEGKPGQSSLANAIGISMTGFESDDQAQPANEGQRMTVESTSQFGIGTLVT